MPRSDLRKAALRAVAIFSRMAAVVGSASSMLRARSRPCWRMPTLTTGRAKEAASMMPLVEFPSSSRRGGGGSSR